MATFLVASTPITAHTLNATRVVTGLVAAGHRVLWYAADRFAGHARRCGAEPVAQPPSTLDTAAGWTSPGGPRGLSHVRRLYRDQIAGTTASHLPRLAEALDAAARSGEPVAGLVADTLLPAAGVLAELRGLPWASLGDGPLLWWDEDTPPFGTGLPPLPGPAGRHRNRHVQQAIDKTLFAPAVTELNRIRGEHRLAAGASIRDLCLSSRLHLQGCSPSLEYPRRPMPAHVHFIGALGPGAGFGPDVPAALRRDVRSRPLAFVTQGTLRPDVTELIVPACRALVAEGLDVLVAGVEDGPWNRYRGRVHAVARVDYMAALAEADLFVTNGGWTGVTLAVDAGVPIVQCGGSEEKPDIGSRVRWAGVGAGLPVTRPPAWLLRAAVRRVLRSPRRREASRRLADESSRYRAETRAAALLEEMVGA